MSENLMKSMTPRPGKRRGLPAAIVAVMSMALALIAAPAAPAAAATGFSDVPASHQFAKEITWLAGEGITTGYADGTFRPRDEVSREAFAAFLYRLSGKPSVSLPSSSPFKDVAKGSQFYKEIVWLSKQGITTGWADGTFRPKNTIDRDAMAAFLYRYEGSPSFSAPKSSPFKDMSTSSKFYKEVTWLRSTGVTTGYADGTFRPKSGVSREATAAFLYRLSGSPYVKPLIPTSFSVKGAGYGHGVGMSQYGAQAMALDGKSASDILTYYYKGTAVSSVEADKKIKVEVYGSGSDWRDSATLVVRSPGSDTTHDGQWRLRFYSGSSYKDWTGINNEYLHLTRSGNSVTVERDGGKKATATTRIELVWEGTSNYQSGSSEDPYVDIYNGNGASKISGTHGTYRHGKLIVSVPSTSSPRLIIANELKLNTEYLYGIAEVPSSWDADALQAQAIVARGYALRQMGNYSASCNCHIYDDTRDQNFSGWKKENEGTNAYYGKRWVAAVNATASGSKGKVLTSGGAIAQTYYFSSSGGQTENSKDIWGGTFSYLTSVDDPWSESSINPNRSWTQTLSQSTAKSAFGLTDVVSIKVTGRTAGGSDAAATKVTATSSTGKTSTITGAERIRSKLANGKSPWLWSFTANY